MNKDHTKNRVLELTKQLLVIIGHPFFHSFLLFFYIITLTIAFILKRLIQLIKLVRSVKDVILKLIPNIIYSLIKLPFKNLNKLRTLSLIKTSIISLFLLSLLTITAALTLLIKELPNPEKLTTRNQIVSTKILATNGDTLYTIFENENRTLVNLEDIPQHFIDATVAIEDRDFYKHSGYSLKGIIRAIKQNLLEGKQQGGSTITQQLVKNALLTPEKTIKRKIKEIVLSILVETRFNKEQILTMYFNEVAYGGAVYGAEEASLKFFNKHVEDISLPEAALLAALPAAPTHNSPFGTNPQRAKFRQHQVLRRMAEDGYITYQQAETAKTQKLEFAQQTTNITAPHFVMYVRELLVEKFGEQLVEQGGLIVTTSLDPQVQKLASQAVSQEVKLLKPLNITNGAALVTKPSTGEILAMVGSHDFFDFKNDGQVNATLRPRQPGSAIKAITYSLALENGFTPATIIADTPITYHIPGQPPYSPKNYDNTFHGNLTLRDALANSYNVPAVKTLSALGVDNLIQKGNEMGITTWKDNTRFGLSLTLGGGEITMKDLAVVYGSLANQGKKIPLNPILKVTNSKGKILYQNLCFNHTQKTNIENSNINQESACDRQQVVTPETAFIISDILSDNEARSRAFGRHSVLHIPNHQVAVKTGTTQNLRDNWTIGYTQEILVATWVGNFDNTPMSFVASGITGASTIWSKIISSLLTDKPEHKFQPPPALLTREICPFTGTLKCQGCPTRIEYFLPGTQPTSHCLMAQQEQEKQVNNTQQHELSNTQPSTLLVSNLEKNKKKNRTENQNKANGEKSRSTDP